MILRIAVGLLWVSGLAAADWTDMKVLTGEWIGEGSGKPGAGAGEFSFVPELQGKILVRRSFAEYPGTRHDDLMIVYREGDATRADYYDSEGHVIRYAVQVDGQRIVFVSDGPPKYRLTYTALPEDKLRVQFDIDSKTYLVGVCRRKR
jgi:hypothetical protein